MTKVMTPPSIHPGAGTWRADTVAAPASWYYGLPDAAWSALDDALAPLRRQSCSVTELTATDAFRAVCAPALRPALEALETGCGFAIIEGVPVERLSLPEAQAVYWLVGQVLGIPF